MTDLILAIAHHFLIFALLGLLTAELAMVRVGLNQKALKRLALMDVHYGLFAGLILAVGFARVYYGVKGPEAYIPNPVFWTKVGLFLFVGLLSAPPTIAFLKWRKASKADEGFSPGEAEVLRIRKFLLAETVVFLLIPVFAALMARGYGLG